MSIVIDTGVFYAVQNERSDDYNAAKAALSKAISGEFGRPYTTDYVYDETITLVRSRTNSFREASLAGDRILGRNGFPDAIDLITVSEGLFDSSITTFERYQDHALSFTDASTITLIEEFDFDGIVHRLDPERIAS